MLKEYTIEDVGSYGCIYKLTSPSGKCYIGQTWCIKRRYIEYTKNYKALKRQPKLFNAVKKYNIINFNFEIIDLCQTQVEMDNKERFYIEIYDSIKIGYNIRDGGSTGKLSDETKLKMSKIKLGKKFTDLHKSNLSLSRKGQTSNRKNVSLSKETKEKISKSLKISNNNKNYNEIYTNEVKEKMSKSHIKYDYSIISPDNIEYKTDNLWKFCIIHNLSNGSMVQVANGYRTHYKNWKVFKTKKIEA